MSDFHEPAINPALILRSRYTLALSLIALLIISSQIAIQLTIAWNDDDSRVVNIAGRQRMLVEKIAKASLAIVLARDAIERAAPIAELRDAAALWKLSHDSLLGGSRDLQVHGRNSRRVLELFARIEPDYLAILDAAATLGSRASKQGVLGTELGFLAAPVMRHEKTFLQGMDEITFQYDRETRDRLDFIRFLEYALLAVTCLTLTLEALFIFLPAERQINRYFRDMRRAVVILKERATYDEMTGLYNKHTGLLILDRELEKARRLRSPLSLCFIDLDGLKAVNDAYGHEEGDDYISRFAKILREAIRAEDAAFRFGGDEFILILGCDAEKAGLVVARIRKGVDALNRSGIKPWSWGFSRGIASYDPARRTSPEEFITMADEAMYADKEAHRDAGLSPRREA